MRQCARGVCALVAVIVIGSIASAQPAIPVAKPAAIVKDTSFQARWSAVSGATSYRLDVSADFAFGTTLPGYGNIAVADTALVVRTLSGGTAYFYRVRATNGSQTSGSSNPITIITWPGYPNVIPKGTVGGVIYYSRFDTLDGTVWKAAGDGTWDSLITKGSWPRLSRTGRYIAFHRGQTAYAWQRNFYIHDFRTGKDSLDFVNTDNAVDFCFGLGDTTLYFDYVCGIYREKFYATTSTPIVNRGDCWDDNPVLSPGDSLLAFHNAHHGVLVSRSNGANIQIVPKTQPGDFFPNWSPDGQWLTFSRADSSNAAIPPVQNLYKVRPDGTGFTQLTFLQSSDSSRFRYNAAPTPDGQYVVVPGKIGPADGLFAVATDGSGRIMSLATGPGKRIEWVGNISGAPLTTSVESTKLVPGRVSLDQNYPNPFNPSTNISFTLPAAARVVLIVYDILGQEVVRLANGPMGPGVHHVTFDGVNLPSGVYFSVLRAGDGINVRRMLLVK
jgi:hypothetical protein